MKRTIAIFTTTLAILIGLVLASPLAYAVDADGDGFDDATGQPVSTVIDTNSGDSACQGITGDTTKTAADCKDTSFFSNLVKNVVGVLTFIVGGIAVIMLVIGAVRYAISGGDANAVQGAKNTILYAIVGLVVAASAFLIVRFVIGKL